MKKEKMELIINESNLVDLLREYIKEMITRGYGEWYIGKTLPYIFESLEKE